MRYIPEGMLEKQYRWELVHIQLYYHLYHLNTEERLQPALLRLLDVQEKQLQHLRIDGIKPVDEPDVEFPKTVWETVKMLYEREYELLQEYLSYQVYFLHGAQDTLPLSELLEVQREQVNTLLAVMNICERNLVKHMMQKAEPYNVWMDPGYRLEKVADALSSPSCLTFDDEGHFYVLETGGGTGKGRILRYDAAGMSVLVDKLEGPATGITWHGGCLYVAEGNARGKGKQGGRILKIAMDGTKAVILSGLATYGDHSTGDVRFGPDGRMYFSVGTATNAGVVGPDNEAWLRHHPDFRDCPARETELSPQSFISSDGEGVKVTGAFQAYGQAITHETTLRDSPSPTGVLYSCRPDGSHVRVVADGLRNPCGLAFSPFDGRLYATDHGCDARGSRPIYRDWDHLWEIRGGWYGWPDLLSGLPCTLPHFSKQGKQQPLYLLQKHPRLAAQPIARFEANSFSGKFDFSTNDAFGYRGEAFVAQIGSFHSTSGEGAPAGFRIVRTNLESGQICNFLWNEEGEENTDGPIRPVQAKFNPDGTTLYVVDYGRLGNGMMPKPGTGAVWRVTKQ